MPTLTLLGDKLKSPQCPNCPGFISSSLGHLVLTKSLIHAKYTHSHNNSQTYVNKSFGSNTVQLLQSLKQTLVCLHLHSSAPLWWPDCVCEHVFTLQSCIQVCVIKGCSERGHWWQDGEGQAKSLLVSAPRHVYTCVWYLCVNIFFFCVWELVLTCMGMIWWNLRAPFWWNLAKQPTQ